MPPAAQDPAGDLSAPIPQRNSEPAVMSAVDVPVISALSALSLQPASAAKPASAAMPASAAIPDSTATPAIAEIPIPRTMAPSQQYVQTGERAPKLSAVPSRQEVLRVMEVLLSNGTPFKPIDVVHVSQRFSSVSSRLIPIVATPVTIGNIGRINCSVENSISQFLNQLSIELTS